MVTDKSPPQRVPSRRCERNDKPIEQRSILPPRRRLVVAIVVVLLVVVGALTLPRYRSSAVRAKESVLKHDLRVMRDVIRQFYTDRGRYPTDLEELVSMGYLRDIPRDPMTGRDDWRVVREMKARSEQHHLQTRGRGITGLCSASSARALDGATHYNEW